VHAAVLEADRESQRLFAGHGAALAAAYNHAILPLANRRDKQTEILWGVRDFERRFGRAPEGMWLPEAAVNVETLEVLAEHGIRFTVLSPCQAARVRRRGEHDWHSAEGDQIDTRRAYVHNLPSGRSIGLFFYDGALARAVACEGLLARPEEFVD